MSSLARLAATLILCATAPLAESAAGQQAAPPAQDPAPVFRASADVVSVEASVRRDRRPVVGLTAADFTLLDNGVQQQITDVSYEKLPIDVVNSLFGSKSKMTSHPCARNSRTSSR